MKKLLFIISCFVMLAFVFPANAQTNLKLGYIDSNELLELMPGKDSVERKLMEYQSSLETQIQNMYAEYQTKANDYRVNAPTMSDIIKQTKEKEILDLEERISTFQQTAETDFQNKQQELYNPLIERARTAIKAVADENGYTYIFDTGMGTLLYFERGDNILPLVKTKLGI